MHTSKFSDIDYRSLAIYNLYKGTAFGHRHLHPQQAVLWARGVFIGEPPKTLAAELGLDSVALLQLRQGLPENARCLQSETPISDFEAERGELSHNTRRIRG